MKQGGQSTTTATELLSEVARQAFKLRAELVERAFALTLDRGGMRRAWLRGRDNVQKRYLIHISGYNLGLIMRSPDRLRHLPETLGRPILPSFGSFAPLMTKPRRACLPYIVIDRPYRAAILGIEVSPRGCQRQTWRITATAC